MSRKSGGIKSGTHDVKLDGLERCKVNDLKLFCFGQAERCEVLREALDALGSLGTGGLKVCGEVLDSLTKDGLGRFVKGGGGLTSTSMVRKFSETVSGELPMAAAGSSSSFLRR